MTVLVNFAFLDIRLERSLAVTGLGREGLDTLLRWFIMVLSMVICSLYVRLTIL